MLHASTQKLILKLCELTSQGDIRWREGEGATSVFDTEGYQVEVAADPLCLRILTAEGREIERVGHDDLLNTPGVDGEGSLAADAMLMAEKAHRIARGAETAISRILSALSAPPAATDPEPMPAAPEFDTVYGAIRVMAVSGAESEAAIAAVAADMALSLDTAHASNDDTARPPLAANDHAFAEPVAANDVEAAAAPVPSAAQPETPAPRTETPPLKTPAMETQTANPRLVRVQKPLVRPAPPRAMFGAIASFAKPVIKDNPATAGGASGSRFVTKVTAGGVLVSGIVTKSSPTPAASAPADTGDAATARGANPYAPWS